MDYRIRFALGMAPGSKLSGQIEADETFIGGKARNMHAHNRAKKVTGTGGKDKTAVLGILERAKVRTKIVDNTCKKTLQKELRQVYRFNNRHSTDAECMDGVPRQIVGKRLTWDRLIGKDSDPVTTVIVDF